jgi:hypothetical protein
MKRVQLVAVLAAAAAITAIGASQSLASGAAKQGAAFTLTAGAAAPAANPAVTTIVNFDQLSAPCGFGATVHLKKLQGVKFKGKLHGGGGVLNECSNFNVSGYSSPNFLAFNCNASFSDGTVPALPETIALGKTDVLAGTHFFVASGIAQSLHVFASNVEGQSAFIDFPLSSGGTTVTANFPINKIVLSSTDRHNPVCLMVFDDLVFSR